MTSLADASPDQMRQALAAVLAVHHPVFDGDSSRWLCDECCNDWPCDIGRAITAAGIEVPE